MKSTIFILLAIIFFGCSRTESKDWRQNLLNYENDGYKVMLNKKVIKVNKIFLDKRVIKKIEIDDSQKVISLTRKDVPLHLIDLYSLSNNIHRDNELFIIDGFRVERKDFESTELEMKAVKSVSVNDDTVINGHRYSKVYIFETYNNDR